MTTEPSQDSEREPRRFDDVASLFGTIVPAPGAPLRPMRPFRPIPTALPKLDAAPIVPMPRREQPGQAAEAKEPPPADRPVRAPAPERQRVTSAPEPPRATPAPGQVATSRPRPIEMPWPDAFEPRPNFKPRQPRQWAWLLIVPAVLAAAGAVSFIDVSDVRNWVLANVFHRSTATPALAPTMAPRPAQPLVPPPPAETTVEQNPYPAIPLSPRPVPPVTEATPPPQEATAPDAPASAEAPEKASSTHINIQYRRNIPGAEGEARRLAALLQGVGGSVELRPNATTVRVPTINYYNASDREAASALALVLSHEASSWSIRQATGKNPPGVLDVWLP